MLLYVVTQWFVHIQRLREMSTHFERGLTQVDSGLRSRSAGAGHFAQSQSAD